MPKTTGGAGPMQLSAKFAPHRLTSSPWMTPTRNGPKAAYNASFDHSKGKLAKGELLKGKLLKGKLEPNAPAQAWF